MAESDMAMDNEFKVQRAKGRAIQLSKKRSEYERSRKAEPNSAHRRHSCVQEVASEAPTGLVSERPERAARAPTRERLTKDRVKSGLDLPSMSRGRAGKSKACRRMPSVSEGTVAVPQCGQTDCETDEITAAECADSFDRGIDATAMDDPDSMSWATHDSFDFDSLETRPGEEACHRADMELRPVPPQGVMSAMPVGTAKPQVEVAVQFSIATLAAQTGVSGKVETKACEAGWFFAEAIYQDDDEDGSWSLLV